MKFKHSDFVQVSVPVMLEDGTCHVMCMNALYMEKTKGGHAVIYSNARAEEIPDRQSERIKLVEPAPRKYNAKA